MNIGIAGISFGKRCSMIQKADFHVMVFHSCVSSKFQFKFAAA